MIETINQQLQLLKLSGIKQALKQQLEQPNLYRMKLIRVTKEK